MSAAPRCFASHEAIKHDRALFAQCLQIGILPGYNDAGERDASEDLALANCTCGSTLSMPLAVTVVQGAA